ncbi:hypothetical protein, partial [Gulbenkiania mobilis]|uniref:hypothetical protein n=1 Tax=Gulbenkiania mobilis TaxID=397457 RepID=UPI001F1E4B39
MSKASRLSMSDWSTADAAAGGERDKGAGFFPFSFFVGAMAMERGRTQDGLEAEAEAQGGKGNKKRAG